MQQINDLIGYFKNINEEKIVDILIAIIIVTVFCVFSSMISYLIIKLFMRKEKDKEVIKANAFYLPLKTLFIFIGLSLAIYILNLPEDVMIVWKKILKIVVICIVAKGLVNLVDPKSEIAKKFRKKDATNRERTVQRFSGRILKYVIYIVAAFFILKEFNYDLSGLMAGLGIASAVVALAAQDIVKGLISGMSILTEKPFLVGDWIQVGTVCGTVIDITFRTTKIKTPDNTIVSMENSFITSNSIINWAKVTQRRYAFNLKLPLETNADKVDTIVNRIRFVLPTIEGVVPETVQIHFDTISTDGINIMGYLYTTIVEYEKFLAFRQEINEQILKILESENVKLAYPSQNIYIMNSEENQNNVNEIERKARKIETMKTAETDKK